MGTALDVNKAVERHLDAEIINVQADAIQVHAI